ncbi:MAG: PilC/PilY family type IV pilus protein, partial [Xanthomonadales bacterium]|nr:PilC/PilY family type IV pilus protein [Xanthomonadales bacterium]
MNLKPGKYRFNSLTASLTLAVSLCAGLLTPVPASASVLLPKVPLFVNISTTPNIFLQMDDSGSMDWDILTPTHFTTCRYNNKKYCNTLETTGEFYDWTGQYSRGDRIFRTFEYVETSQDDAYSTHCYGSDRDNIELCGSRSGDAPWDWRVRSASLNVLYFNPTIDYSPWPGYSNASFGSARSYPDPAQSGYYDTDNLSGFVYHYWIDDKGFSGSRPDKTDDNDIPNNIVDEWDSHVQVTVDSAGYSCKLISYPNATSSGLNPVETELSPGDAACKAAMGVNANLTQLQQNVANWFQYYRRRNMVARASVARVVTDLPSFRYGFSMINDYNLFVEVPEEGVNDYSEHNADLLEEYLEYPQRVHGTPLRRGLERVGRYYDDQLSGKEDPIVSACQKNFSILFSDGYWNGGNPYIVNRDVDRDGGYISNTNVLLADVAEYYYKRDLSPLPNLVPTDQFDSASHQHMVTFTVGFGVNGSLIDTDDDGWPDNLNNGKKWYTSDSTDNERKVDDLWHAAWNSRGEFISAKRPEELIEELGNAILEISDRIGGAASGATNGGSISSESKVFQAKFDAVDWHGSLLAINVNSSDGELDTVEWEAGELLDQKSNSWFTSSRNVLTYDRETGNGTEFKWASLNDTQQQLLNTSPANGNQDGLGQQRVNYIRGSSDGEGSTFRNRAHRLGDIAHSDPEYVSFPPFYYPFDGYQQFALSKRDREAVIYVGANDGMLHAFSEETGQEMFAFVPNEVMHKLPKLTYPNYYHDFFVDGSPIYGDIQSGLGWKSVLIGSFRSGGQGIYALDITDPGSFTASDVMWEFTDEDDADLGYVFGEPQIRKMANGKWGAIFTSGYNNSEADGNVSPDGDQFVYILNIEDGTDGWSSADYRKIALPSADGLSAPAVADVDGDSIADFIYVGDLDGNMWKID